MSRKNTISMLISMLFVAATTLTALIPTLLPAASLTLAEEIPNEISFPNMLVPKWSNGALIFVRDYHTINPTIWVVEHQSPHVVPFTIPGARSMNIYDWDRGMDGTIGLSGSAVDADGRAGGFVAWISSDERTSKVIQTLWYAPWRLAVAPDGTLWAAGSEFTRQSSGVLKPQSDVVRHFDQSGTTLGSFVPQSTIRDAQALLNPANRLRATGDRIASYLPAEGRYIEISFAGKVLTDISVPRPGQPDSHTGGLAITDNDEIFVSAEWQAATAGGSSQFVGIFTLDKSAQAWRIVLQRAVTAASRPGTEDFGRTLGVDGNRLVLDGPQRLKFYKIGE
jgi:hypothetical protein